MTFLDPSPNPTHQTPDALRGRCPAGRAVARGWRIALLALALGPIAGRAAEAIVGRYAEAFRPNAAGWAFFSNESLAATTDHDVASSGANGVTDPQAYRRLAPDGATLTGPDGVMLSSGHGHTGRAASPGAGFGRYAIAAFKVDREGYYAIRQSRLRQPDPAGGELDLIVHVDGCRPLLRKSCGPAAAIAFDGEIGSLAAGSVIYVAVGPRGTVGGAAFELDFQVCRGDTPTLQAQIDQARASGATQVRIVPGRYYASRPLTIDAWEGFDIDASGVTLITPPAGAAVTLTNCRNGRLRGLTIDQDPLPLTQGQVVSLNAERTSAELKIDDFHRIPAAGAPSGDRNMIFDAATLDQKQPATGFNVAKMERLPGDRCRLTFRRPVTEEIAVGDLLSIEALDGPPPFAVMESEKMVIEAVTLHSSPAFSFFERAGGENTYRNLRLTPGPPHVLSNRPRLRTAAADGFHSRDARIGPKVFDSLFERTGDDGMAIDGPWGVVIEDSRDRSVWIAVRGEGMLPTGEPLRFYRFAERNAARASVATAQENADRVPAARMLVKARFPAFRNWKDYKHAYLVTLAGLDQPNLKAGDLVAFPARNGDGFEFRNNVIRGGRSRGIIVKANGIIAGNRIEKVQKPGILVYSAFGHDSMEAQFVEHLVISDNVIDGCNFMRPIQNTLRYSGGIVVTADTALDGTQWGPDGHHDVRIENNTIRRLYRGVNLVVSNASNVIVRGNRFLDTHRHPGGCGADYGCDNRALIWIDQADGVRIENCEASGLGENADPGRPVSMTPNARNVTGTVTVDPAPRVR